MNQYGLIPVVTHRCILHGSVSYTHLDVYKRQIALSTNFFGILTEITLLVHTHIVKQT